MLCSSSPPGEALDFAEVFAGAGAVSSSLAALGYRGRALDREHHASMDFLQPLGLLLALRAAMAIHPGGVMWLAPPCSSWVWLTRHSSGRDVITEGDLTQASIVAQNALVERVVLVLEVLHARGVHWIVEQPASSVLWDYPAMQRCIRRHAAAAVTLDMGAFKGGTSVKPTVLYGTAPYLQKLERRCSSEMRLKLRMEGVQTTKRSVDSNGVRRCQGTADLKGTQAYPWGWGAAHALAFAGHYGPTRASRAACSTADCRAVLASLPTSFADAWWLSDFCGLPL